MLEHTHRQKDKLHVHANYTGLTLVELRVKILNFTVESGEYKFRNKTGLQDSRT